MFPLGVDDQKRAATLWNFHTALLYLTPFSFALNPMIMVSCKGLSARACFW